MSNRLDDVAIFVAPALFVLIWATGFIGGKYGLPYAEPFTLLSLRMISVVAVLAVIILISRPVWPGRRGIAHSAATGTLIHGMYLGGVFVSIHLGLSPALSALVVGLQPVLTSTVANRLLGDRVSLRQWGGLILGFIGIYLVVRDNLASSAAAPPSAWVASTVALIGITAGTLYQKRFGGAIDWRCGFIVQYSAAGILFVAAAFAFETRVVDWNLHLIGALAWMVLVLSLGAIWLLYYLVARQAATRVVSLFYLVPPVTALMAWPMFGDRLDPWSIVGMAACALGVLLVNLGAARAPGATPPRRA
jgi:drug/metabolite transporter (DMT)-like permease